MVELSRYVQIRTKFLIWFLVAWWVPIHNENKINDCWNDKRKPFDIILVSSLQIIVVIHCIDMTVLIDFYCYSFFPKKHVVVFLSDVCCYQNCVHGWLTGWLQFILESPLSLQHHPVHGKKVPIDANPCVIGICCSGTVPQPSLE